MSKRILCPVDFSTSSDGAADLAASLASVWGADLTLLHVVDSPNALKWVERALRPTRTDENGEAQKKLTALRDRLAEGGTSVEPLLLTGEAGQTITRVAAEMNTTLIVLATHNSMLRRRVLGSVGRQVTHSAPSPVLLVRGDAYEAVPFRRPLVCIDFSLLSSTVARAADELVMPGCPIEYLHVVDDPRISASEIINRPLAFRQERLLQRLDNLHQQSRRSLAKFCADCRERRNDKARVTDTVRGGPIASTILAHARENRATLIAIGSHRPENVNQMIFGTVADRVISESTVPVLLCPVRAMQTQELRMSQR